MTILLILAIISYSSAGFSYLAIVFGSRNMPIKVGHSFAFVAIISHLIALSLYLFHPDGWNFSLMNAISLVTWFIVTTTHLIILRYPAALLLPIVNIIAAILMLILLVLPTKTELHQPFYDPGVALHVLLSFTSYCVLMMATLYAIQSRFISKQLKNKNKVIINPLIPPLIMIDKQQFQLLMLGTFILTLSLISGFLFLPEWLSKYYAHKTVLSILAWITFITCIWGYHTQGWRGNRFFITSIFGATLLTLSYFGSRFVREILLNSSL